MSNIDDMLARMTGSHNPCFYHFTDLEKPAFHSGARVAVSSQNGRKLASARRSQAGPN